MAYFAGHCDGFFYRGSFNPRHEIAIWSGDVTRDGRHAFCLHGRVSTVGLENDPRRVEAAVHDAVFAQIRAWLRPPSSSELHAPRGFGAQLAIDSG